MAKISRVIKNDKGQHMMLMARHKDPRKMTRVPGSRHDHPLRGPYRGTKMVSASNAKLLYDTGFKQKREALIQLKGVGYGDAPLTSLPPSEVELYWDPVNVTRSGRVL